MGCATGVVKYLVFIFNLIFALAGLAILIIGILFYVNMHGDIIKSEEINLMGTAALVFIIIGAIIFLIAFFGCCGAIRESTCMLTTFAVILLGLFIMQVAIGIFMFIEIKGEADLKKVIDQDFDDTVRKYNSGNEEIKQFMDGLQHDSHCCGSRGPRDWNWNNGSIPATCCIDKQLPCTPSVTYVYTDGCSDKVFTYILTNVKRIAIAAIVIAFVELIGAIFALCLSSSIRNQYRRGAYA